MGGVVLDAGEAASPVPNPQRQAALRRAALETPPASASKFKLMDFPQLDQWSRGKICLRIRDTIAQRDNEDGPMYTLYAVRVAETPSLPGYTVWRRYSAFSTLREAIVSEATNHRSSVLGILASTPFPSKVWFGSMDVDVVEERRELFDHFLRVLSSQCTDRTMMQLRGFLTPNDADVVRAAVEEDDCEEGEEGEEGGDDEGDENVVSSFVRTLQEDDPMQVRKLHAKNIRIHV